MLSTRSVYSTSYPIKLPLLARLSAGLAAATADVLDVTLAQRILARKGLGDQRVLRVYDSPSMPEAEVIIELAKLGIYDATD